MEKEREMRNLSQDLIDNEIIFRFPVKSLLRFRCVSKPWCALIDSKDFVKKHLNHSIGKKSNRTLVFEKPPDLYSLGLNSLTEHQSLKLVLPNQPVSMLLGSHNGLLCIFNPKGFVIWNPAIKKHFKVTKNPFISSRPQSSYSVHGFGYDEVSDDYKLVIMLQYLPLDTYSRETDTSVYSLRSNSWTVKQDFPDYVIKHDQIPGALACGALHWIGAKHKPESDSWTYLLFSFNLLTDKHTTVMLPDIVERVAITVVAELGGCLSIVFRNLKVDAFDVWLMKNYGARESWTKLLTLVGHEITSIANCLVPLAYSKSGDEVLLKLNSKNLVWYNLKSRTHRIVAVSEPPEFDHAAVYQESLVSPGHKAETDEKQVVEKKGAKKERKEKFLSKGFKLVL